MRAMADSPATFDVPWYSVDGGGGASRSGRFECLAVVGQADAGTMDSPISTVAGGFLGLFQLSSVVIQDESAEGE
ncbi:MAG TPA: hypothetical protein VF017_05345 [Thermoanaerobaculia bacterium]|nr:hypothetical protein [Thermoanaerobaculia bacterium]